MQRRLQPILDRFGRDVQARSDLAVGVPQADQRGHVLFTRRERLPFLPESLVGGVLRQASVQEGVRGSIRVQDGLRLWR